MDVILLERIGKLGHMGDTVRVKDGYARNFLLPRGKALRATEANKKKFEGQRAELEARNHELKRSASEIAGQGRRGERRHHPPGGRNRAALRLGFGARHRRGADRRRLPCPARHVAVQHPIKTLGLHPVPIHLHPEVEAKVTVNVARSPEQAERQAKGEDLTVREQTSMDDLGLEVGKALAEAGPGREPRARVRRAIANGECGSTHSPIRRAATRCSQTGIRSRAGIPRRAAGRSR